jgi:hypothetical protein
VTMAVLSLKAMFNRTGGTPAQGIVNETPMPGERPCAPTVEKALALTGARGSGRTPTGCMAAGELAVPEMEKIAPHVPSTKVALHVKVVVDGTAHT